MGALLKRVYYASYNARIIAGKMRYYIGKTFWDFPAISRGISGRWVLRASKSAGGNYERNLAEFRTVEIAAKRCAAAIVAIRLSANERDDDKKPRAALREKNALPISWSGISLETNEKRRCLHSRRKYC